MSTNHCVCNKNNIEGCRCITGQYSHRSPSQLFYLSEILAGEVRLISFIANWRSVIKVMNWSFCIIYRENTASLKVPLLSPGLSVATKELTKSSFVHDIDN